jgi:hypothetical protein
VAFEQQVGGEQQAGRDDPRDPRTNLFIAAVLEADGASLPVTVRNLSDYGALVEGPALPALGTAVRLLRGSLHAAGTVAWSSGRRCGLRLTDPVPVALWMAKPGNVAQAEIDAAVRALRAGRAAPSPPEADTVAAPELSVKIRDLEALLDTVSDDLAAAPETVARHSAQLQSLDLLAQGLAKLRASVEQSG